MTEKKADFKIEKGFSISTAAYGSGVSKYPWLAMEIGDSFFSAGKSVQQAAASWNRDHPDTKFTTRSVEGGCRVWRIR